MEANEKGLEGRVVNGWRAKTPFTPSLRGQEVRRRHIAAQTSIVSVSKKVLKEEAEPTEREREGWLEADASSSCFLVSYWMLSLLEGEEGEEGEERKERKEEAENSLSSLVSRSSRSSSLFFFFPSSSFSTEWDRIEIMFLLTREKERDEEGFEEGACSGSGKRSPKEEVFETEGSLCPSELSLAPVKNKGSKLEEDLEACITCSETGSISKTQSSASSDEELSPCSSTPLTTTLPSLSVPSFLSS